MERRRTLVDRLQALETQLKHLAATVVNYRAKVRSVEAGNRKLGQDHSVLCQPIADWGDIGERLANIQVGGILEVYSYFSAQLGNLLLIYAYALSLHSMQYGLVTTMLPNQVHYPWLHVI